MRSLLRIALLLLVVTGVLAWLIVKDQLDPSTLASAITSLGVWAPVAFAASFAAGALLFVPGSLFGLAGGALFGPVWGAAWNLLGSTLGATCAFVIARYIGADWIAARTGERLQRIIAGVEAEGWRFVALTRLLPIVPFNALNYALGLTKIPLLSYVLATAICMIPGAAAYAWLGYAGRAALEGNDAALRFGLWGLALLAMAVFLPRLVRRMLGKPNSWISATELAQQLKGRLPPLVIDVREPDEFEGPFGHIASAANIPMGEIQSRLHELRAANVPIVLVCRTDKRSAKAATMLQAEGIQDVRVLRGGMESWNPKATIAYEPGKLAGRTFL